MDLTNDNGHVTVKELLLRLEAAQNEAMRAAQELTDQQFKAQDDAREANDKRYEQRFLAQETAVAAALSAQKEFTASTLLAADKAVAKAETAADLRYSALSAKLDVLAARYENSSGAFTGVGNRNALLVNYFMSGLAIVVSAVVGFVYMFHR